MAESNGNGNGNGNGFTGFNLNGKHWAIQLLYHLGFPMTVAILLLATLLGWMPSPLMDAIKRIEYHSWVQTNILRSLCYQQQNSSGCDPWKDYMK